MDAGKQVYIDLGWPGSRQAVADRANAPPPRLCPKRHLPDLAETTALYVLLLRDLNHPQLNGHEYAQHFSFSDFLLRHLCMLSHGAVQIEIVLPR